MVRQCIGPIQHTYRQSLYTVSSCVRRCNNATNTVLRHSWDIRIALVCFLLLADLKASGTNLMGRVQLRIYSSIITSNLARRFPDMPFVTVGELGTTICVTTVQWRRSIERKLNPLTAFAITSHANATVSVTYSFQQHCAVHSPR